ncbi:cytochrome c1 [Luteimonas pelagia]
MTKHIHGRVLAFVAGLMATASALAAGGGNLQQSGIDLDDRVSLQRGAALYMNYCSGCHSLKYMRYSRIGEDLGLTEEQVQSSLNFTGAKYGEQVLTSMRAEDAQEWFGQAPPDLSLVARVRGADWIYTYLKSFYLDDTRPLGWNNTVFPNASMPNVLWELQGLQRAEHGEATEGGERPVEHLVLAEPGSMGPAEFDQAVRDITAFLEYAGEPAALKRQSMGVWVVLFLAFFTFLAWLLKREYWKDVH